MTSDDAKDIHGDLLLHFTSSKHHRQSVSLFFFFFFFLLCIIGMMDRLLRRVQMSTASQYVGFSFCR
jgi:hypothetical protein